MWHLAYQRGMLCLVAAHGADAPVHLNPYAPQPLFSLTPVHLNPCAPQPLCTSTPVHLNPCAPQPLCTSTQTALRCMLYSPTMYALYRPPWCML